MTSDDLLRHHGDVDAAPGLVDFAVNVRGGRPPEWLLERLVGALGRVGVYPSAADDLRAREAVAARHGCEPEAVVVLNGSAEGFSLVPRVVDSRAAVVHPQFTEPEVALRSAGVPVHRVLLDQEDGFRLHPDRVPQDADLVVIGNPTNPTSTLHPADAIREIANQGRARTVLVDEAFMDAIPGEPESLAGEPDTLVFRSLTKTWALPGLRAGYAIGHPDLIARLTANRPQWPVSTLVLEAVTACCEAPALAESEIAALDSQAHREALQVELADFVLGDPRAPFLLVQVPDGERVRGALRDRGIAVRRGDTFPGLGPDHLRVAVRSPRECEPLIAALRAELEVRS
ncbi:Rv2231c family pyridoxal phosphate-dependent protein CobC [Actinokineospora globicatena]|uniref:Rv2231c family pyridoxal phosphate-dependent protein CobC n=1 Tax=Actinokineospora globicatena TaxID=103729 RepID=UPI0020A3E487|nr:Rv2231c family pyridoxal phosphate-dependent protein CobC [Actinokineospora globicatena]MCP2300357.1 L-threonine O-3-phosphate decarboxylase [Actinokineospora globicatena]GLW80885.1 aminotransferase [Actinokineospora globicatena]GLW88078.1 aminotransferase [Actinokineospora globicatena]